MLEISYVDYFEVELDTRNFWCGSVCPVIRSHVLETSSCDHYISRMAWPKHLKLGILLTFSLNWTYEPFGAYQVFFIGLKKL